MIHFTHFYKEQYHFAVMPLLQHKTLIKRCKQVVEQSEELLEIMTNSVRRRLFWYSYCGEIDELIRCITFYGHMFQYFIRNK